MTNVIPSNHKVDELIEERGKSYGIAWQITGKLVGAVPQVVNALIDMLRRAPEVYMPWMMILNKLVRILAQPYHKDSWKDIAGYAVLVSDYLEQQEK